MKKRFWAGALAGVAGYIGLPYLLVQVANLGLIRSGRRVDQTLALTFDDGPDPATTPQVLDALREAGAKATFFVLPDHAEAHPELILRMLAEGHQVEAHGNQHRHAWLRSPWGAYTDPRQAAMRVQKVTGVPVTLHRPPHGAYTLATILGQHAARVTGAHWSIEGRDWHRASSPQGVRERLGGLLMQGSVIVLHDAGPGAINTVPMLPGLLADLQARGYRAVTLADLDGAKPQNTLDLLKRLFAWLDTLYDRHEGVIPLNGRADSIFRVGPMPFPLAGIQLNDGTPVPKGTPAAEFHVSSMALVDIGPRRALARKKQYMQEGVRHLQTQPDMQDVQVVYCLSALSAVLAEAGFEEHPLPPSYTRRLWLWAMILRWGHGKGRGRKARPPQLSIISREGLVKLAEESE